METLHGISRFPKQLPHAVTRPALKVCPVHGERLLTPHGCQNSCDPQIPRGTEKVAASVKTCSTTPELYHTRFCEGTTEGARTATHDASLQGRTVQDTSNPLLPRRQVTIPFSTQGKASPGPAESIPKRTTQPILPNKAPSMSYLEMLAAPGNRILQHGTSARNPGTGPQSREQATGGDCLQGREQITAL